MRTQLVRPAIPPALQKPCAAPVALPDRDLTASEIVPLWGRDRTALKACEGRRAALVEAWGR